MTLANKIEKDFLDLPQKEQAQVLDFMQFIKEKQMHEKEETTAWDRMSLSVANEENDDTIYTVNDLKEVWK